MAAPPAPQAATRQTGPAASAAVSPDERDAFSLQLGAFRDAKNAHQMQSDLKERGYSANIFSALDSEQREWHTVRIGGFDALASASRAAIDFTGKERIQGLVRRSNAL